MFCAGWVLHYYSDDFERAVFRKINQCTEGLTEALKGGLGRCILTPKEYSGIAGPLHEALNILYKQTSVEPVRKLLPIRVALSRLLDIALPLLARETGFMGIFDALWVKEPLYRRWQGDHYIFYRMGCLEDQRKEPTAESFAAIVRSLDAVSNDTQQLGVWSSLLGQY